MLSRPENHRCSKHEALRPEALARYDLEKRALAQVPGSKVEVRIAAITRSARYAEKHK